MMTVDNLLLKIVNFSELPIEETISAKDARVLRSLAGSIGSHFFITENQSRLLVKILRENSKKIPDFSEEIESNIISPTWSRKFRQLEQVKKMYIDTTNDDDQVIVVEFTYNSQLRKILQELPKKCENLVAVAPGKKYTADLTETNLVAMVEAFEGHAFEISDTIKEHYATIKSWSEQATRDQFLLTNIEHKNFLKAITNDLGVETIIDKNIINDRSMRYQYFTENAKNHGETLTEVIANRSKPRVWIDKSQHSLNSVFEALVELRRLPLLVVFDTVVDEQYYENLKILSEAIENSNLQDNVGVYFRLPNGDAGKKFNTVIADKKYNCRMDENLKVAAVMSGKLPKFFLSNPWRPMSVLALDSRMGMRHGKTAVYGSCSDCIVEWAEAPSIHEQKVLNPWR